LIEYLGQADVARPKPRVESHTLRLRPSPSPQGIKFKIGGRIGLGFHSPWPFGTLWATRDRIEIDVGVFGQRILLRERVEEVFVSRWFIRRAVLFKTDDCSGNWVVAYAPWPDRIIDQLAQLGWPVS
jgi:hypothetical protein